MRELGHSDKKALKYSKLVAEHRKRQEKTAGTKVTPFAYCQLCQQKFTSLSDRMHHHNTCEKLPEIAPLSSIFDELQDGTQE